MARLGKTLVLILSWQTVLGYLSPTRCFYNSLHNSPRWYQASDREMLPAYLERACGSLTGHYSRTDSGLVQSTRRVCYNVACGGSLEFEITNDAKADQTLDLATCYRTLTILVDQCKYGGELDTAGFHYVGMPATRPCSVGDQRVANGQSSLGQINGVDGTVQKGP